MIVVWLFLAVHGFVCDCGISRSYSLTIFNIYLHYYINMSNSNKESFTFLNRDVAFSPRD